MIKIDDFQKNKEKIIVIILIVINLIFFYFCCGVPYKKLIYSKEKMENYEVRLKKVIKEKEIMIKIYETQANKNREIEQKYDKYIEIIREKSLKNIGEFERIIYKKLKSNNLYFKIIGRVEKERNEGEGKVYISYEIVGKKGKVINFINELENGEKLISLGETPIYFETKEDESKIKLKIAGYILNILEDKEIEKEDEEIKGIFLPFEELNILEKKILELNKNKYLLLKYKKGGREIFLENEKIEKNGKKYRIKIKEDGIYLENGEIK